MKWLVDKIQTEPNALAEIIRTGMYLMLGFEVIKWTDAQQSLVLVFVSSLLTFFTRRLVMPTTVIEQAGQSVMQIKKAAAEEGVRKEEQTKQDKQEVVDLQAQQKKDNP